MTTGAPILTKVTTGVRLAVEVAWTAVYGDPTGSPPSSWIWSEITSDVLAVGSDAGPGRAVSITIGRADESSQTNPSLFTCTLDNRSGRYSQGGQSPLWPNVRRGVPVRCYASVDGGVTWSTRFYGTAVSWQPGWDAAGRFATVVLTASGPLRALNQGTLPAVSAIRAGTVADPTVTGYWPCEDEAWANYPQPAAGIAGNGQYLTWDYSTKKMVSGAASKLGADTSIPASAPVLTTVDGGSISLPQGVPISTVSQASVLIGNITASNHYDGTTKDPLAGTAITGGLMSVGTPNCSVKAWDLLWTGDGGVKIAAYSTTIHGNLVSPVFTSNITFNPKANVPYELGIRLRVTSSSVVEWLVYMTNVLDGTSLQLTGTQSATGSVELSGVSINPFSDNPGLGMGHVTLRQSNFSPGSNAQYITGYPGENVINRLQRLLGAANIPFTSYSYPSETSSNPIDSMGCQYWDTLTGLIRECETTAQGFLFDGFHPGLTYVPRQLRQGQQATLVLDAALGDLALSFEPVDDDHRTINQAAVTRRSGTTYTWTDTTSPLSATQIGVFATSATVNPNADSAIARVAQWLVHLGTVPGYRYPTVHFALDSRPSKIAAWLNSIPTSRLDITNITGLRAVHPAGTIRQIVEGWTETIDANTWRVVANCSPWSAWNVGTLAASTGTTVDTVARRDTDGSATNAPTPAGATSVQVKLTAAGKPLWTTAADDFPLVASIAGNPVTVTGISGATSPQTFVLAGPGLPVAVPANAEVRLWNPPVLGV